MNLQILLNIFLCYFLISTCAAEHKKYTESSNIQLMRTLLSYSDNSVDPCDNFYAFTCNKWSKVIGREKEDVKNWLELVELKASKKVLNITALASNRLIQQKFVKKIINFYYSCESQAKDFQKLADRRAWFAEILDINLPDFDKLSSSDEHDFLEKEELIDDADSDPFSGDDEFKTTESPEITKSTEKSSVNNDYNWLKLLTTCRQFGLNNVFWNVTGFINSNGTLDWQIFINQRIFSNGFQPLPELKLKRLFANPKSADKMIPNIQRFEKKVSSLYENFEGIKSIIDSFTKEERMMISWDEISSGIPVDNVYSDVILFKKVLDLLKSYDSNFVGSYIFLRFLSYLDDVTPQEFTNTECINHTWIQFSLGMDWIYKASMNENKLKKITEDVTKLFNNLKKKFAQILKQNRNHYKPNDLKYLEDKLENLRLKIDNLPAHNATKIINDFYDNLNINKENYYGHLLKVLHFHTANEIQLDFDTTFKQLDFMTIMDNYKIAGCSPYYSPYLNLVTVPLILLQFPIYDIHYSDLFKYSSLGGMLSHEITHAFDEDSLNSTYYQNKSPNKFQIPNIYRKNVECLSKINSTDIHEKIADVNGIRLAFETFFENYKDMGNNVIESDKELFLMNYAATYCDYSEYVYDLHGSTESRVNDALLNLPEFANAFNCSLGSPMNPKCKCQMWRR